MTRWETWRSARTLEPAHVGAVLLLLVLAGIVAIANRDSSYDDSYITFRYAANFAKGEGLVYNEGSEILGTTAPLYALVLGVLGLPNPDAIPAIGGRCQRWHLRLWHSPSTRSVVRRATPSLAS